MTRKDDRLIEFLLKIANKSCMKSRCGAILMHRNKIISTGYNRSRYTISTQNRLAILYKK